MDNLNINSFDFNRLINHCTILIASSSYIYKKLLIIYNIH